MIYVDARGDFKGVYSVQSKSPFNDLLPEKWRVQVYFRKRTYNLGVFKRKAEAVAARLAAEDILNLPSQRFDNGIHLEAVEEDIILPVQEAVENIRKDQHMRYRYESANIPGVTTIYQEPEYSVRIQLLGRLRNIGIFNEKKHAIAARFMAEDYFGVKRRHDLQDIEIPHIPEDVHQRITDRIQELANELNLRPENNHNDAEMEI